jgi:hypothetical protein
MTHEQWPLTIPVRFNDGVPMPWGHKDGFPEDMRAFAGLGDKRSRMEHARLSLDDIERLYGAPRDPALVENFLNHQVPEGRLLVYGAGTHTPFVLELLQRHRRITIVGIVDRMGEQLRTFQGYDVFTPQEIAGLAYDHILLSHGTYEDEMLETLLTLGVPMERIIPIYIHPAFHDLAKQAAFQHFNRFKGRHIDTLIVSCTPTVVVPDWELSAIFPPDRTVNLHFGRPDSFDPSGPFETLDLHESLHELARIIQDTRPKTVYIRSIIYKNYLGYWIKQRFPKIKVIHELYDHAIIWRDHDLERLFGLTKRTIARLRLTEYAGAQVCDLIVSKRGGPDWASVLEGSTAPYRLFFPMMQDIGAPVDPNSTGLIYAGFLPAPAFLAQFKNGYDFLPIMREVCDKRGIQASLYNAAHLGPDADRIYAAYIDAYRDGPLKYCRRLPYEALLREMGRFAYGWLCDRVHEFQADRHVGICNRWTGYVSAGLPVVMDADWRLMADLTRSYNAGLVVERAESDLIARAMDEADHEELRLGSRHLRTHLLRHNAETCAAIARVMA